MISLTERNKALLNCKSAHFINSCVLVIYFFLLSLIISIEKDES